MDTFDMLPCCFRKQKLSVTFFKELLLSMEQMTVKSEDLYCLIYISASGTKTHKSKATAETRLVKYHIVLGKVLGAKHVKN